MRKGDLRKFLDDDARIVTAEAERIGDGDAHWRVYCNVGGDVQIAVGVGLLVADGGRDDFLAGRHGAGDGLNGCRAAQQMTGHRLGRGHMHALCRLAQRLPDGDGLVLLIERRGRAMRVDVVDILRRQSGILDRAQNGSRCRVARRAVACNLGIDGRTACLRPHP